jgi:hypothetical protein
LCIAAKNGHLDVVKWCRENECEWDENTCANAAENGHLLDSNGVNGSPLDSRTCYYAAENGHLDVIKWLHESGCPRENVTFRYYGAR